MIRHVLIAEDEPDDVFFLKLALEKAGIKNPFHVVEDGQQLLDYLKAAGQFSDRRSFPRPALLLLDTKLPCISGLDVLRWIRSSSDVPWLPVIILTSSALRSDIEEAYAAGANSYVIKPSAPGELANILKDLANWWLKDNVLPGW